MMMKNKDKSNRSIRCFVEQELGKLPHFLLYATLEWMLIIMLFIDGFIAFAANEFARFFDLKIPCLLCTRIDHVLVQRDPDFYYNDSICDCHKKDVSSLAYCHVHKKISDIRQMCEACLLSFATEKSSDCDTYKSLVGILHKDLELLVDDDYEVQLSLPSRKDDWMYTESSSANRCACCGAPLKAKSTTKTRYHHQSSVVAPSPSPRVSYLNLRNDETPRASFLSSRHDETPRASFLNSRHDETHLGSFASSRNLELPHMRYSELKLMSEHETHVHEEELNTRGLSLKKRELYIYYLYLYASYFLITCYLLIHCLHS